jgi:hypothetical protein
MHDRNGGSYRMDHSLVTILILINHRHLSLSILSPKQSRLFFSILINPSPEHPAAIEIRHHYPLPVLTKLSPNRDSGKKNMSPLLIGLGSSQCLSRSCTSGGWPASIYLELNIIHGECVPFESDSLDLSSQITVLRWFHLNVVH